jgi:hypothetical protein
MLAWPELLPEQRESSGLDPLVRAFRRVADADSGAEAILALAVPVAYQAVAPPSTG